MRTPFDPLVRELRHFGSAQFVDQVPRDHRVTTAELRRRQLVVACTLLVGIVFLGWSLRSAPGAPSFYGAAAALAVTWTAGSFASGPLHLGRNHTRSGQHYVRPVVQPVLVALGIIVVFVVGALVAARIPLLEESVNAVLDHARLGYLPLVVALALVNGVAEELFFRGALYSATPRYPVTVTTVVYTLTTIATGSLGLVLAAAVLGLVVGLQRRVTGGVLAPVIVHCVWSLGMLLVLPTLMERAV
ncbi:CPBP family intramembrane metalloprotease [Kytococcus schroeteri]|uniref:CPBP family intramembrane metalloprotease n=1 Tax=Kytococcus schroeteri TaxID=138300 RepID=A0A2I1PCP0_9MICO|nr:MULTISPECIES: type II CAAX endopeptidase family protein [Kytococcus]OFS08188.1 abortive infection protein [Kytococcus sp. HMSC28H12]PKZ42374.1 CPBP family intramembrane metalloprotease [Kytococcus schroeteri]